MRLTIKFFTNCYSDSEWHMETQMKSMVVENNCKLIRQLTEMKNLREFFKGTRDSEKKMEMHINYPKHVKREHYNFTYLK